MELELKQLAIVLRPLHTETARRLCIALIKNDALYPDCIDSDEYDASLVKHKGKSMMSSLDSVLQLKEWQGMIPNLHELEDTAFDEACPNLLQRDLDRLSRAVVRTSERKWQGLHPKSSS